MSAKHIPESPTVGTMKEEGKRHMGTIDAMIYADSMCLSDIS